MSPDSMPGRPSGLEAGLRQGSRVRGAVYWLGAALALLHLVMNFTTLFSTQWQATLHFVGLGVLALLLYPPLRGPRLAASPVALALDLALAVLLAAATLWVVAAEDGIYARGVEMTGIGNTLSLMIQSWAGGSLLIALVLVALASLVLGMGLPVTAAYIVLATLSAPAIYNLMAGARVVDLIAAGTPLPDAANAMLLLAAPDLAGRAGQPMSVTDAAALLDALRGLDPSLVIGLYDQMLDPALAVGLLLSAHMIIFWLSQDSNVTPPVCLTAFAAAAIAGTHQLRTGLTAWKLAKGLYIVPLLFAYTPLLYGDWPTALGIFTFALLGMYALAAAFQGQLETRLGWPMRLLLAVAGVALLWPNAGWLHWGGLVGLGVLWGWDRVRAGRTAVAA